MILILTQYIAKHELKPLSRFLKLDDILYGAEKAIKGLATKIKSPKDMSAFHFFKVYIGPRDSARMIIFVTTGNQKAVPVLIRLKKDKIFGANMAINNPEVVYQMNKNLNRVIDDIKNKAYEEFTY